MEKTTSTNQNSKVEHSPSENVYENTILVAKRARQILLQRRADFATELEEFGGEENLMDAIQDTSYQERIAKKYEKKPKPITLAIKDVQEGNIIYSYPDKTS